MQDKEFSHNIWTSEKIKRYLTMIENGERIKDSPFYENNLSYRKANIVFEYTNEEISEIVKCASDIVYYANNYCHVMTDEGVRQIILRDYQKNVLRGFVDERFNILLASR